MTRFNYIITTHNKEDLIEQVLIGVLLSAGVESHIYVVLDGCTDRTEQIIDRMMRECDGLPITKLHAPDVHEILSINLALRYIGHDGDAYNILVQDDVILSDRNFEAQVLAVYGHFNGKIGMLSFHHGVNVTLRADIDEIGEQDIIESCYGQGMVANPLMSGMATVRMVGLRSPECITSDTVRRVGLLDERYAPYTYDDHDFGLRCLKAGLANVVYAVKIRSRVEWGGMRRNIQPRVAAIMRRNRRQVYSDHKDFIGSLRREDFVSEPVRIRVDASSEDESRALREYDENRRRLAAYNRRERFNLIRRIRERIAR
jgi:glycosyltransferase involved in cell wall biosynthesis